MKSFVTRNDEDEMGDYQQKVASSFQERKRLNRLRRRKENLRFWEEFRIIPRGLIWTVVALFVIAQLVAFVVSSWNRNHGGPTFAPEIGDAALEQLALAGVITLASFAMACFIFLIAYVNRDAKRRGMNAALWTLLVIVLLPAWTFIGFLIYFLMREPLPYDCPQCGRSVSARFNFCPNCKCNLHPLCPNCKQEVGETDKFCANCAYDLGTAPTSEPIAT